MTDRLLEVEMIQEFNINDDGTLSLPSSLLQHMGLHPGDTIRLVVIGGELRLIPSRPIVSQAAEDISQIMRDEGVTAEDLLSGLDEARDAVFRETYGDAADR